MLVPLNTAHVPSRSGTDESTSPPGAATSGLSWSETGVGPPEEKLEIVSAATERPLATEPTVIALAAVPGEPTDPLPNSSKSLPAASAGTTPASAAALIACTTMSRVGSISGSPSERLITSIPSLTAASIPAAISGALPSRPTPDTVGTVSTL
jgi:hypothetical protein